MKKMMIFFLIFGIKALLAQWEPDVRLTYADQSSRTGSNNAWSIATNGDTVHVVWFDARDGNTEIYYKRSLDNGSNWEADVRLTNDAATSSTPSIAVLGSMVHVAWFDTRAGMNNFEIYYKRSTDGGATWGPDVRLTDDPAISWYPSLALSNSYVHIVWRETRAGNYEIYYKRSTDEGETWSDDLRLTYALGSSETPCIASSTPDLHVLWFDNRDGGAYEIYYKKSTNEGATWQTDVRLTDDPAVSFGPSAAISGSNIHIVWQDTRQDSWELYYKRSTDDGATWGPDTRLTNAGQRVESPSIAASGSNVHIVWWDLRDGNYEIYYKRSTDNGSSWDVDTRLTNDGSWSQYPSIAISDSMLHVVWYDGRAGNDEIYYKRNPNGNIKIGEELPNFVEKESYSSTIISGQLRLPKNKKCRVFDISGRKIELHRITPGIYFIEVDGRIKNKVVKIQ